MLKNAYFFAKIGADTTEDEQRFAENFPIGGRAAVMRRRSTPRSWLQLYSNDLDAPTPT